MKFLALASKLLAAGRLVAAAPNPTKRGESDEVTSAVDAVAMVLQAYGVKCQPERGVTLDEIMDRGGKRRRWDELAERDEQGDQKNEEKLKKDGGGEDDGGKNKLKNLCSMRIDDDCPELGKLFWDKSLAGDFGDVYINKNKKLNENSAEGWVRGLDESIFPGISELDCESIGSNCDSMRRCNEYAKKGSVSAYPLHYSLVQVHSYLNQFHDLLQDAAINSTLGIDRIYEDFKQEEEDTGPDVMGIIAASFSIASAMAPPGPVGSAFGAISGMGTMLGSVEPSDDGEPTEGAIKAKLADEVQAGFSRVQDRLNKISRAISGAEGSSQDDIPSAMQTQTYDNPIIRVFGDGKWMVENPAAGLEDQMKQMYRHMKQALAWGMMRHVRKAFVLVDTGRENKEDCEDGSPNIWDSERGDNGVCFRMFLAEQGIDVMSKEMNDKLWKNDDNSYNLDRLMTFRNAYDCWVDNDGKVGKPQVTDKLPDGSLPKCYFGIKVLKGKHDPAWIRLDKFPGQEEDKRWGTSDY